MASSDVLAAVSTKLKGVSTNSLDISFNELLDMASGEEPELNITPDYQRLFRWTEAQRSRFIETLILEMPVPPIFVIEEETGKWQLIDGLQRISSYMHLRGSLKAPLVDPPVDFGDKLVLKDCDIVTELNDLTFEQLPTALQIRLKRAFIRVEVVRKGTDPHFKYHMFKRLNTGGEGLSEQQIRNCGVRMLSNTFPDYIVRMSDEEDFKACTSSLTQERLLSEVDKELVLRFFALKNYRSKFTHAVGDFLTEYMERVSDPSSPLPFAYDTETGIFNKVFLLLRKALGDKAFAFRNKAGTDLAAGFSILHYEAITIGLLKVLERLNPENDADVATLAQTLREAKLDPVFARMTTGGGKNSTGLLAKRIGIVEERLANAFPG